MRGIREGNRGARMDWRRAATLGLGILLAALLAGCGGDDAAVGAPTTQDMENDRGALANRKPKPKAAKPAPKPGQAEKKDSNFAEGGQDYFYDPRGKRDPFRSYLFAATEEEEKSFGPLGDFELAEDAVQEAIAAAKKSLELAKAAGNQDYVRMNEKSLKEWMK